MELWKPRADWNPPGCGQEDNLWQTLALADAPDVDAAVDAMPGADPVDDSLLSSGTGPGCVLQNRSEDVWVDLADRSTW